MNNCTIVLYSKTLLYFLHILVFSSNVVPRLLQYIPLLTTDTEVSIYVGVL